MIVWWNAYSVELISFIGVNVRQLPAETCSLIPSLTHSKNTTVNELSLFFVKFLIALMDKKSRSTVHQHWSMVEPKVIA